MKTKQTDESVAKFLDTIPDPDKRKDCIEIAEIMKQVSKFEPKMWGTAIIGFGNYHYKYESGREGDTCLVGFSPRKKNITLYATTGIGSHEDLLEKLGKYKMSKSCLYINKLSDINTKILKQLIKISIDTVKNKYG
ncbi:MAG: DUF1801 domain-containing protein [Ginsengibacter sp.]